MRRIFALLVALGFLAGCESLYYDMVMDSPQQAVRGKDDAWDRAGDASRVGRYH